LGTLGGQTFTGSGEIAKGAQENSRWKGTQKRKSGGTSKKKGIRPAKEKGTKEIQVRRGGAEEE